MANTSEEWVREYYPWLSPLGWLATEWPKTEIPNKDTRESWCARHH